MLRLQLKQRGVTRWSASILEVAAIFWQEEIKSNDCSTRKRVSKAVAKFGETAAKYSDVRLAALALSAQLLSKGHFDDIVESIDKMVTNLKAEYKEDL